MIKTGFIALQLGGEEFLSANWRGGEEFLSANWRGGEEPIIDLISSPPRELAERLLSATRIIGETCLPANLRSGEEILSATPLTPKYAACFKQGR